MLLMMLLLVMIEPGVALRSIAEDRLASRRAMFEPSITFLSIVMSEPPRFIHTAAVE